MKVINFKDIPIGALVTRSPHYIKDRCIKKKTKEIGLIVDKKFYQESNGLIVCWPVVHFEGRPMSSSCHPALIVPYRKQQLDKSQWVEIQE